MRIILLFFSVIVFLFSAHLIAYLNNFQIGDWGGYYYLWFLFFISFALGAIVSIFFLKSPSIIKYVLFFFLIAFIAFGFNTVIFYTIGFSGSYFTPKNLKMEDESEESLVRYVFSKNESISEDAIIELEKRSVKSNDILLEVLIKNKSKLGEKYNDGYVAHRISEILAVKKDKRVLPFLYDMLKSPNFSLCSEKGHSYKFYYSRSFARRLLKKYFNKDVNVTVNEEVINNQSN